MEQHFLHSSYREKLIEHLFVGELLKISWLRGEASLEIAKPEVDNRGYDLIAERGAIVRHIQLKTTHSLARAASQKVHLALRDKPSGCVVWIEFDSSTLALGPFRFFGGAAGVALGKLSGFKIAKHVKPNMQGVKAERPGLRVVPKREFTVVASADELFDLLFHPASCS